MSVLVERALLFIALLLISFTIAALSAVAGEGGAAVVPANKEPLPRGLIVPHQEALLSSLMEGQIQTIHKQEGERFQPGEPLVTFYCPVRQARLQQSQAALTAARKRLRANRELAAVRSASPLDVALSEAELLQAEAELAVQSAMVDMCLVRAPFAGRVNTLQVHPYETVPQGKPLLDIASEGHFEVRVILPSYYYAVAQIGTEFSIHLEETRRSYPVRVIRTGGRIDPVSQTLPIVGQVVGTFPELLPGMGGPVSFPSPQSAPSDL
ncbi:MAG: HlyD family efflux transporter periplasmic adaptor subunit [Magnetococcales bacterium]|nr:HlyD family efflux transporter periplasmic adaptor subunit [Magnetococcales bacterium]